MPRILHLADRSEWSHARQSGRYETSTRGRTLGEEGFIHASTLTQAAWVLKEFYAGVPDGELLLLILDPELLEQHGSPVRWDDVPGQPAPFPHIYGPIVPAAAVAVLAVQDGELPDVSDYDVAP